LSVETDIASACTAIYGHVEFSLQPSFKWQGYRILISNDIHAIDEENSHFAHFHVNTNFRVDQLGT
jgi:hypothetical protein